MGKHRRVCQQGPQKLKLVPQTLLCYLANLPGMVTVQPTITSGNVGSFVDCQDELGSVSLVQYCMEG